MLNGSTNQVHFAACQLYVPNQLVRCLLMQDHHSVVDETRQDKQLQKIYLLNYASQAYYSTISVSPFVLEQGWECGDI